MAITISQQPTNPGLANSNLVFNVVGNFTQPQFQYVCDIYISGSTPFVQRIKQQPNPAGRGVFDLGQIITNYVDSDETWKTPKFVTASNAAKRFRVLFGEQYGTSPSSSVTLYTGVGSNVGEPVQSASAYYYLIDGLVEPEEAINWNWPSSSYYTPTIAPVGTGSVVQAQNALTYAPLIKNVQLGEYETISIINGNFPGTNDAQDVYALTVVQFDVNNSVITSDLIYNTVGEGGGPRTSDAELWSAVSGSQTPGTQLLTAGVGPANLADATIPLDGDCVKYEIRLTPQASPNTPSAINYYALRTYNVVTPECGYEGVRFAWKNQFGVWDYYTFTLQSDSAFNVERNTYTQTFVNYGTTLSSVPYSKSRRGIKPFYNKPEQLRTANSNWLTQDEADWLRELFFSTNVFIQDGEDFLPAAIVTSNLLERTNPRTQQNFQYVIEFTPANQLRPRK
jgi:hypothetical protein